MDQELNELLNEAARIQKVAEQKLEFVQANMGIDPFTMIGMQQQIMLDWIEPEFDGDGKRRVERLRFDIYCHQRLIAALDQMMRAAGSHLHVIQNGQDSGNDADKPDGS